LKISELSGSSFISELQSPGIWLCTGPFQIHLQTSIESLARSIRLLYEDFDVVENPQFADFHVRMEMSKGLRRHVFFSIDDEIPFQSPSI